MMLVKLLVSALIFVAFVPGVITTLPPGGSKWVVLAVHGVLFTVLNHLAISVAMSLLGRL